VRATGERSLALCSLRSVVGVGIGSSGGDPAGFS
jgi:hypothetical protein